MRGTPGALLTALVLLAGATLTWLAWNATMKAEAQRSRAELAMRATDIQSAIESRLLAYEGLLRAGVGLMDSSWPVRPEQWQKFAKELRLAAVYPGVQGIGFSARIHSRDDLSAWADTLRIYGVDGIERTLRGGRLPNSVIVMLEPLDERNRRAIGFDMMSESHRRLAMERAQDTGAPTLTSRVVLVQESGRNPPPGFLLYVPVYASGVVPPSIEQRRAELRGFVYAPFRASDFFEGALTSTSRDAILEVFDGKVEDESVRLYRSAVVSTEDRPAERRHVLVAGQEWTLRVSASQAMMSPSAWRPALLIASAGAAVTILLAGIVMTLAQSRQRLRERIEADLALAHREHQASQVLENTLDAYIAIDPLDRILEWNRQAELVFGWSAREAIGKRLTETIIPPALRRRHYDAVSGYADRATHPLLGKRLEMPAMCKNGTQITVELSIIEIDTQAGPRFAASLRDITDARRREKEVRDLNESLEQRVAERTAQLEVVNRDLSAANRELEAFTYTVSHDLRAPLRAIDGHVQRLTEQPEQMSDTMRHHAAAVRRNVARMNQLIDDLLNFAFISRKPLVKQRVALWDVVRPILHELQSVRPIVYDVSPDSLGVVRGDPALLTQAMMNLLSNAAKFSRNNERPRISVGSETTHGGRVYYVQDNGVGFDMRYADKLFGVFERLHTSREFEGTGVGLAIVKQIIERHGGRIWAESEPGQGATFRFTLPDEEAA